MPARRATGHGEGRPASSRSSGCGTRRERRRSGSPGTIIDMSPGGGVRQTHAGAGGIGVVDDRVLVLADVDVVRRADRQDAESGTGGRRHADTPGWVVGGQSVTGTCRRQAEWCSKSFRARPGEHQVDPGARLQPQTGSFVDRAAQPNLEDRASVLVAAVPRRGAPARVPTPRPTRGRERARSVRTRERRERRRRR